MGQFSDYQALLGILRGTHEIRQIENLVIRIDRTTPFDPVAFLGEGWSIDEQDDRLLGLTELDLTSIRLVTMLKEGEDRVGGEEKLKRLKGAKHTRLDAKVFHMLWENKHLIPERWKERVNGNVQYIFFDGTILRGPHGRRYVLGLYWFGGAWRWLYRWLARGWGAHVPSAVLAS